MGKKTVFGAALLAALLAALVAGSAWAQGTGTQTLQLTPSRGSGVSGTATLSDTSGGVQVKLQVQGLPTANGTEHLAHIHSGATCADDRAGAGGPVEFPLNSVIAQGGAGTSTTVVRGVTLAKLFDGTPRYVNVHAQKTGAGTPPGIACADLAAASKKVPATGGPISPLTALVLGGAVLVGLGTTAGLLARRRA